MEEISNNFLDTYNIESSANNHTDKGAYLVIFTITLSLCNEVPSIYCMHKMPRVKGQILRLSAYDERRRVNLNFCLADFVYLIQKPRNGHYNSWVSRA